MLPDENTKNPSRCLGFYLLKSSFCGRFSKKKKTFSGQGYILL